MPYCWPMSNPSAPATTSTVVTNDPTLIQALGGVGPLVGTILLILGFFLRGHTGTAGD